MSSNSDHLLAIYAAVSSGAQGEELAAFFHPEAEQIEYPSLLRPSGHRRGLQEMLDGAALGATIIREQRFEVHTVVEQGDQLAVQLTWTATAARELGAVQAGDQLVSHVAAFYLFRDGLVLRQSSYDCYEPIPTPGPVR